MAEESPETKLARIEEKLDNVLRIVPDHETRLRIVEQKKEECQQDTRLDKIETRLDSHDTDLKDLKKSQAMGEGATENSVSIRECVLAGIMILEGIIITYQFIGGTG